MKVLGLEKIEDDALRIMILAAGESPKSLPQAITAVLLAELGRRTAGGRNVDAEIDLDEISSEALLGFQIAVLAERKVFARKGWTGAAACCYRLALEANAELTRRAPASARGPMH